MKEELLYQIALTLIEGVGDVNAKSLLAYCGSAESVFKQKKSSLLKIPGIGEYSATQVQKSVEVFERAEEEIKFISKNNVTPLFFTHPKYPRRLKNCSDSPILLYYKGNADLNTEKIISVVGTRSPSEYGKDKTKELISDLENSGIMVVSGMAYGVDIIAHKTALDKNLETVGVLAHGMDRIYPSAHSNVSKRMLELGGLLTDFMSGTNPDAVNFPKRNRIVAGMCDAVIVMESKRSGGSLITAVIANGYNKDVFAFPGKAGDEMAEGCNGLIKKNRAALIENANDLLDAMNWNKVEEKKSKSKQIALPINLSEEENKIIHAFNNKKAQHIDELCNSVQMPVSKVSGLLLQLEFNNMIKSKPGKMYEVMV